MSVPRIHELLILPKRGLDAGVEATVVEEMEAHSRFRRMFSTTNPSRDHHPGPIVARGKVAVPHRTNRDRNDV